MSQIDELRSIIIGANAEELAELKQRIEDLDLRTKDVAEVLPPAIDQELRTGSNRLVRSLREPVSISLKQAIRREPKDYAEILYPVMAPSIRRAIAQAISSMMVTINRTIASATTITGLSTRWQAWRTGVPYAELVLRQSLVFRVEHAYLIHRETGLLISEASSENAQFLDSDAVGAMFTALQSFVQDSFAASDAARLTDLKVGDHNVRVAHGPHLMLACVVVGEPPEAFTSDLYDALDQIRTDFALALGNFDGDTDSFRGVEELLFPLLQIKLQDIDDKSGSNGVSGPVWPWIIIGLIAAYFFYAWFDGRMSLRTVEHLLKRTPGMAATDVYWQDDQIVVEGLRDPDAQIPFGALQRYGIEQEQIRFQTIPFRSLEVGMELQRFRGELDLPPGVYLASRDDKVYLYGESPIEWLIKNDVRIRQLAADRRLHISELSPSYESVSDMLRNTFANQDLKGITMNSVATDNQTILQIGGQMPSTQLALLQALFAGNNWVQVDAVQQQSDSQLAPDAELSSPQQPTP